MQVLRKLRRRIGAATVALLGSIACAHGCGIDLSDELSGRPCKDNRCLPGYVCTEANTCVLDPSSGGEAGSGGSSPTGGTEGVGGSTEGAAGTEQDARNDAPIVPDASTGGTDGTAGTGGSAGRAGTAGTTGTGGTAGTSGTAGTAGTGGSSGTDAGSNPWPGVGCRQLTCTGADVCCVATFPGFPTPPPATAFSCAPATATCEFTLECDGDHDCATGTQCCAEDTAGGWVTRCLPTCTSPRYRVGCTRPEHCGNGLVCCGVWSGFPSNRFASVLCSQNCNGLSDRVMCASETDCGVTLNCDEAASLPGFRTCQ